MILIWILVSIILFSIIVLVHEFWHFAAARFFWVKVEEFGLWIPPRAKKLFKDKKWTLFSLNWLPIWGFVKLYWENPNFLKNKNDKNALFNKPAWQQSIIILAWVFMNFLLASIIFSILFFTWIKPIGINTKIETDLDLKLIPNYEQAIESWLLIKEDWLILSPVEWSIAEKAGIEEWDVLLKSPYPPLGTFPPREKENFINAEEIIKIIWDNPWNKLIFTIKRNNKTIEIPIIPSPSGGGLGRGKIGSYISPNITLNTDFQYNYWFINSIKYWFKETFNQSLLTVKWLWMLVWNILNPKTPEIREEALSQVRWPIWIVDFISDSLKWWIVFLIIIWAVISINLWVFNLLPIPALDGWRFLFITINGVIEKIFWKKAINENTENIIHVWFFMFLIALSLLIAYNDISTIFFR